MNRDPTSERARRFSRLIPRCYEALLTKGTIVSYVSDIWKNGLVDFIRPVQSVIPGAQGRILAVLAETSAELNLRSIARLSGVSLAQTSRVMPSLVELGVVERREAPPSALFRFVPDNIASRAITSLTLARPTVLAEMGTTAARLDAPPVCVVVFGSFARGEADSRSDIDLLVVRPRRVDEEDPAWRHDLDEWAGQVSRLTGNRTEVLEVGEAELPRLLRGRKPLWADIQRDGVVVFGSPLAALKEPRGA
jgi:DNA-binding transcriptional ArsR family regulator